MIKFLLWLIAITAVITSCGLFSPGFALGNCDLYAIIAKHIVVNHDWVDLTMNGQDWLDKPHFPFWISAIFYKLFGISTFSYILPGLFFNFLGALYTYKLARCFYSKEVSLLSCLIYLTTLRLMLSAVDIRAEAYLLGQIIPACYYWYRYYGRFSFKTLLLGALFTGMALMTKGLFVLLPIISGLAAIWIYTRDYKNFVHPKWMAALLLSFIFTLPEVIALYLQFDLHPEKVLYGHTHVSGVRFFFWDSQFGRFFNTGPIQHTGATPLFMVETFFWTFLPWCVIYCVAVIGSVSVFFGGKSSAARGTRASHCQKNKLRHCPTIYLLASFFLTFLFFAVSHFQGDHYSNIIYPFAAILCAAYLWHQPLHKVLYLVQMSLLVALAGFVMFMSLKAFAHNLLLLVFNIAAPLLFLVIFHIVKAKFSLLQRLLLASVFVINMGFIFVTTSTVSLYLKYDLGYQITEALSSKAKLPLYDAMKMMPLEWKTSLPYFQLDDVAELQKQHGHFYLVASPGVKATLEQHLSKVVLLGTFTGRPVVMEHFFPEIMKSEDLKWQRENLVTVAVFEVWN